MRAPGTSPRLDLVLQIHTFLLLPGLRRAAHCGVMGRHPVPDCGSSPSILTPTAGSGPSSSRPSRRPDRGGGSHGRTEERVTLLKTHPGGQTCNNFSACGTPRRSTDSTRSPAGLFCLGHAVSGGVALRSNRATVVATRYSRSNVQIAYKGVCLCVFRGPYHVPLVAAERDGGFYEMRPKQVVRKRKSVYSTNAHKHLLHPSPSGWAGLEHRKGGLLAHCFTPEEQTHR